MNCAKRPIRILFISHSSRLFGAEKSLLLFLSKINKNNYEPLVVLPDKGELEKEIKKLNIKTHIMTLPWWTGPEKNIYIKIFLLLKCILLGIISSYISSEIIY